MELLPEISQTNWDSFIRDYEALKIDLGRLDQETIERLLLVAKSKSMLVKKHKLSNDLELQLDHAVKRIQERKIEFVIKHNNNLLAAIKKIASKPCE